MEGLGDLPGGTYGGNGWAASYDGSIVVGTSSIENAGDEAFRWSEATGMVGLGDLPGSSFRSEAYDVSADGAVVVGVSNSSTGTTAFRWEDGVMEPLPDLPGGDVRSRAYAVSADGRIVAGHSEGPTGESEAVRWVDGVVESLGLPPDGRADRAAAQDISADGSVVVGTVHVTNPNGNESFIWREGEGMDYLPDLPGGSPFLDVFSVSGDGRVAIGQGEGAAGFESFIWTEQMGTRSLREFLEVEHGFDLTGWELGFVGPQGLNHDGTVIVGAGRNPDGVYEAWRAVLPPWPVASEPEAPVSTSLALTAGPNPFRGRTTFRLALPEARPATLTIYDVLGREVATLHDGPLAAGSHSFAWDASALPAGVYLARLRLGDRAEAVRVTVLD